MAREIHLERQGRASDIFPFGGYRVGYYADRPRFAPSGDDGTKIEVFTRYSAVQIGEHYLIFEGNYDPRLPKGTVEPIDIVDCCDVNGGNPLLLVAKKAAKELAEERGREFIDDTINSEEA